VSADAVVVRDREPADLDRVVATMTEEWGGTPVARLGELVDTTDLPGCVAELAGERVGLALTACRGDEYEVVSISTSLPRRGVGRRLLERCVEDAGAQGCRRLWLITTNNNTGALAFYQRLGLDVCALYRNAMTRSRELKPSIPERDSDGVRIDHEIELELLLP
jgi:ribosomal protein S18 acetylase RimI-like enzyme